MIPILNAETLIGRKARHVWFWNWGNA